MIRTSIHGRSARGRAAETAARPPTRTKSSISVVTNRTFKKCPRASPEQRLCNYLSEPHARNLCKNGSSSFQPAPVCREKLLPVGSASLQRLHNLGSRRAKTERKAESK